MNNSQVEFLQHVDLNELDVNTFISKIPDWVKSNPSTFVQTNHAIVYLFLRDNLVKPEIETNMVFQRNMLTLIANLQLDWRKMDKKIIFYWKNLLGEYLRAHPFPWSIAVVGTCIRCTFVVFLEPQAFHEAVLHAFDTTDMGNPLLRHPDGTLALQEFKSDEEDLPNTYHIYLTKNSHFGCILPIQQVVGMMYSKPRYFQSLFDMNASLGQVLQFEEWVPKKYRVWACDEDDVRQ